MEQLPQGRAWDSQIQDSVGLPLPPQLLGYMEEPAGLQGPKVSVDFPFSASWEAPHLPSLSHPTLWVPLSHPPDFPPPYSNPPQMFSHPTEEPPPPAVTILTLGP